MSQQSEAELRQILEDRARLRFRALDAVQARYADLLAAKEAYSEAVMAAHTYGASNVEIARRVKLSETAIRSYIKRREGQQ